MLYLYMKTGGGAGPTAGAGAALVLSRFSRRTFTVGIRPDRFAA